MCAVLLDSNYSNLDFTSVTKPVITENESQHHWFSQGTMTELKKKGFPSMQDCHIKFSIIAATFEIYVEWDAETLWCSSLVCYNAVVLWLYVSLI